MDVVNNNVIYAVGYSQTGGIIYKTTNGGVNWLNLLTMTGFIVLSSVSFINEMTGYFTLNNSVETMKIYRTTNGGVNWNISNPGFGSVVETKIFCISKDTAFLILSTNPMVFTITTNGGTSWFSYYFPLAEPKKDLYFINEKTG